MGHGTDIQNNRHAFQQVALLDGQPASADRARAPLLEGKPGNSTGRVSIATVRRIGMAALLAAATSVSLLTISVTPAYAAEEPVGLGTSGIYSVLGGVTVTNTGLTALAGDLGVSPGTSIVGFPPGIVSGSIHAADAVAGQAQSDLVIAYDDATSRATTMSVAGDLVGRTLVGGVYTSSGPLGLTGTLTLDAQGDKSAVFVFQAASTLVTGSASKVSLVNGAQACNVFWQVGSSATLGTGSSFVGTIMALTSITVTTDTTVEGRALARNGAVTLDNDTFTSPGCETSTDTPTPTPSSTDTPMPTASTSTAIVPPSSLAPSPGGGTGGGTGEAQLRGGTGTRASVLADTGNSSAVAFSWAVAVLLAVGGTLMVIRRHRAAVLGQHIA